MQTKNIFLFSAVILMGVVLFSGCGKSNKDAGKGLNQEQVINSSDKAVAPVSENSLMPTTENLQTPDPGDSAAGKTIKEVDALVGGVSVEDYNASSLDETTFFAE